MKSNKKIILFVMIYLTGLIVYSVCAFMAAIEYGKTFWVSYILTLIAFLSQIIVVLLSNQDQHVKKDGFLGLPLAVISSLYLIIQLYVGLKFILTPISFHLSVIVQVVIFGIFLALTFVTEIGKDHIVEIESNIDNSTSLIKELTMKSEYLYTVEKDEDKKKELKKLYEAIRYSDPMSSTQDIQDLDRQIESAFYTMRNCLDQQSLDDLQHDITDIMNLILKRNALCKMIKK